MLIVATASSQLFIYSTQDLRSADPQPTQTFPALSSPILALLPNPSAFPSLLLILQSSSVSLLDIDTKQESMRLPGAYTAACWSAKGKQFVLGDQQGRLTFFSPDGQPKGTPVERPSSLAEGDNYYVHSINWLENDVFLVIYNLPTTDEASPEHAYEMFIVQRFKTPTPNIQYTQFADPTPAYGLTDRPGMRYGTFLPGWGGKGNWLGFIGTAPSPQLGVLQGTPQGEWSILNLDETYRPAVPMTEHTAEDTALLGMALDLRSEKKIHRGMDGGEELADLEAAPKLLVYTSDGVLASWDLWNTLDGMGAYDGMVRLSGSSPVGKLAGEVSMARTPSGSPPSSSVPSAASMFAGFGLGGSVTSPFGSTSPSSSTTSFFSGASPAAIKPIASTSAFGSSSFGAPSTFGTSAFSSSIKPPVSAFGNSPASNQPSVFGTSTSAFGMGSKPLTFGSSASTVGQPSVFGSTKPAPATAGAFASASPFGGPANTAQEAKKPSPGGFGAFGSSSSTFGTPSVFGASSTPSAFGAPVKPAGDQVEKKPSSAGFGAFGSSSSVFGASSSTTSAFGTVGKPAGDQREVKPAVSSGGFGAFGGSAGGFGSASAFGASSSTVSAFGAKPAGDQVEKKAEPSSGAFGASPTASAFGTPVKASGDGPSEETKKASPFSGGFGAFANVSLTGSPSTYVFSFLFVLSE